jgi:CDP-paratose 2-epimerase
MSVWAEFGPILAELLGRPVPVKFADWRPGDQRVYVSDIGKAGRELNWRPKISVREGIGRLYRWIRDNQPLFAHL